MNRFFRELWNEIFYTKLGFGKFITIVLISVKILSYCMLGMDKLARKGYVSARILTLVLSLLGILLLSFAIYCVILKLVCFPLMYKITSKPYLAEAFELTLLSEEGIIQYGVKCRLYGIELEKIAIVKFSVYNELDTRKQLPINNTEDVEIDSIYPPVGVLVVLGKYGEEEILKIRKVGLDLN
jgi:hypothetical protein